MTKVKLPIHRNPKFRALLVQVFVLSIVVFGIFSIYETTVFNLQERGIKTSSNFFDEVAPFKVGFSPFLNFELGKTTITIDGKNISNRSKKDIFKIVSSEKLLVFQSHE